MEYTEQEKYWIWLSSIDKIGVKRFYTLIAQYGDAKSVYENARAGDPALESLGGIPASNLFACRNDAYIDSLFRSLEKSGIAAVCRLNPDYPALLAECTDAPPVLYKKGSFPLDFDRSVAIVGTRVCTRYGKESTRKIACELAGEGVVIVSGMARGIDSEAHEGALSAGGKTVAVLGCGVDVVYPPESRKLYDAIIENGAILSEYAPGTQPISQYFPARNRIISGMCDATIIIEAGDKSGALITAGYALEQGKDVYALPGNINSATSTGTNTLIRDGAAELLMGSDQILMRYGKKVTKAAFEQISALVTDEVESAIVRYLAGGDAYFEQIMNNSGANAQSLNTALTMLELRGIIKQFPGRLFSLSK